VRHEIDIKKRLAAHAGLTPFRWVRREQGSRACATRNQVRDATGNCVVSRQSWIGALVIAKGGTVVLVHSQRTRFTGNTCRWTREPAGKSAQALLRLE